MEEVTLSNGIKMPIEGYGLFRIRDTALCEKCVSEALDAGYRLFDTASAYFNEAALGNAISRSSLPREELFITSKLWIQDTGYENTLRAFETSLEKLQLSYLDLYLIHQPFGDYYDAWRALEKLYQDGKVRAIGVCNFDEARLVDLCINSRVAPMVNQVELHPFFQQQQFLHVMNNYQVQSQAWGPLCEGQKAIFENKLLNKIGKKYGKTAAQVTLRWNIQRGVIVIPKSIQKEHIQENMDIWDFKLSDSDMQSIEEMDTGYSEIIDHHSGSTAKWLNEWKIHE